MPPIKCPICGGSSFDRQHRVTGLIAFPRSFTNLFRDVLAHCSVCLTCGHVIHSVDDAALEKLRAKNPGWERREDPE